ncbi:DUF4890 domain-containing protein [uncultured Alistipes sp.]|jgi:hypothetical protein|uniref:DUF4890 domain-containing protein n=1 Tax=uncultured Alistipes sp. TaxID=538949 RepID=UPI0025F64CBD|nr:DUF4890 domain-containing protein [uncultured Alistipes sp.]
MRTNIFAAAMAFCLMAGTTAFAQRPERKEMGKERPTAEQMAERKTERMTEKLKLDEKQSKQLYELNLQEIKDMQAQHEKMRADRKAKNEKMKGILTPEQYEQWQKMQQHQHKGMMQRGGQKGDGPQMHKGKQNGKACCNGEAKNCDRQGKQDGKKSRDKKEKN